MRVIFVGVSGIVDYLITNIYKYDLSTGGYKDDSAYRSCEREIR